jgi:hypothetical protein
MDVATLAELLHETAQQNDRVEKAAPAPAWWDWYAAYLSAREQGSSPDDADAARRPLYGRRQASGARRQLTRYWETPLGNGGVFHHPEPERGPDGN